MGMERGSERWRNGESRGEEVKGRERAVEDNQTYLKSKAKVNCYSST